MKVITIIILLIGLLILNNNCNKVSLRKYGDCKPLPLRECPFLVYFEKDTIIKDTLFYYVTILNKSDNEEIINVEPFISIEIVNDSILQYADRISSRSMSIIYKYDKEKNMDIGCKNCFEYYKKTYPYKGLKKNESYKYRLKRRYINLEYKKKNDQILLIGDWYIPEYLNTYCPQIWTGEIFSMFKIII